MKTQVKLNIPEHILCHVQMNTFIMMVILTASEGPLHTPYKDKTVKII